MLFRSRADIASRGYSLYASRYLGQAPDLVNPRPLGDLALAIERGAGFSARELDALTTEEDTGLFYVRLSDIEDGAISDDLANLASLNDKTERQWLRTGDLARIDDDGFVYITGRKKDLIITAGGKNVSPAPMEETISQCPIVSHCLVVGDRRPFVSALVTLDPGQLKVWLKRNHLDPELSVAEIGRASCRGRV